MLSLTMHYNTPKTQFTARVTTPPIQSVDTSTDRTAAVDAILRQFCLPDVYDCKAKLQVLLDSNEPQIHTNLVYAIKEAIGALNSMLLFRKDLVILAMTTPIAVDVPIAAHQDFFDNKAEVDGQVKLVRDGTTVAYIDKAYPGVSLWR